MPRTHTMRMVRTEESGLEEWACPTCGRRLLLSWPPDYRKQVIEPGDQHASHTGTATPALPAARPHRLCETGIAPSAPLDPA